MERRIFLRNLSVASLGLILPFQTFADLLKSDPTVIDLLEEIVGQPLRADLDLAQKAFEKRFPATYRSNQYQEALTAQLPEIKRILSMRDQEIEAEIKSCVPSAIATAKDIYASGMDNISDHPQYERHFQDMKGIAKLFHNKGKKELRQAIRHLRTDAERFKGKSVSEIVSVLEKEARS